MNKPVQLLVLSRKTFDGEPPSAPAFAVIRLTPETVQRLQLLERICVEHEIMYVTTDDVEVLWEALPLEFETWATVNRRRLTLYGHHWRGQCVASTTFRLDRLDDIVASDQRVHFAYPFKWTGDQKKAFARSAIRKLAQQKLLDWRFAARYRRKHAVGERRPPP